MFGADEAEELKKRVSALVLVSVAENLRRKAADCKQMLAFGLRFLGRNATRGREGSLSSIRLMAGMAKRGFMKSEEPANILAGPCWGERTSATA